MENDFSYIICHVIYHLLPLVAWTTQRTAGECGCALSFVDTDFPVYQHVFNPGRILVWVFEGGAVDYFVRVEHNDVREHSFTQNTTIAQADTCCRCPGRFVNRGLER